MSKNLKHVEVSMVNEAISSGNVKSYRPSHYLLKVLKTSTAIEYDNEFGEGHYNLEAGDPILEGTRMEHWSPVWDKITKKYLYCNGDTIDPEELPFDRWVWIQTSPDEGERSKNITWAMNPHLISDEPFEINGLVIDPSVDMLCMGGDANSPTTEWGFWPVKVDIFKDTYELLN